MMIFLRALLMILVSSPAFAGEPVAPTAPTAVDYNVAATTEDVPVTSGDVSDLNTKLQAMDCSQHILVPVATYTLVSAITLPKMADDCEGEEVAAGQSAIAGSSGAHAVAGSSGLSAAASASSGDRYVIIESANFASLPAAGTRIDPVADAANMPTIVAPASVNGAFLVADTGVHHIIFRGIRINGSTTSGGMFLQSASTNTDLATQPHHVYIERSYIHGHASGGTVRGIQATGHDIGVVDSVIDEIRRTGSESQAILYGAGGPGPYLVRNNELVAASENFMIGDNKPQNSLVPSDITFTKNYVHKPWTWTQTSFIAGSALDASTAALDAGGTCVTLTGAVPDAGWVDGTHYWIATGDQSGTQYLLNYARLITAVGACNGANSITLTSAYPARTSTSGFNYKITLWTGVSVNNTKNLFESKGADRVSVTDNVFAIVGYGGNQKVGIQISARGTGSSLQDWLIQNNLFKDIAHPIAITTRPSISWTITNAVSDGTTNCNGAGCVKLTTAACECGTGDTVTVKMPTGTTEAAGTWVLTRVTDTTFSIPVEFVNAFVAPVPASLAQASIFHLGTPTSRIAIKNNIFQDAASYAAAAELQTTGNVMIALDPFPVVPMTVTTPEARTDASSSTTGGWGATDIEISHNTCISPSLPVGFQKQFLLLSEGGTTNVDYTDDWKMTNFTVRDNVCKASKTTTGNYIIAANTMNAVGSSLSHNSEGALDLFTDASRNITHNAFYDVWNGVAHEWTKYTSAEFATNTMAILADQAKVGFTSHSTSSLSNYVLTNLWTTGTCTTNSTTTVTCSDALPATIVKGTPFKINSVGTFRLVESVSGSTITLKSAYPTSNSNAAFTLGFKGWSHELDGTDPGADIQAVIDAIAGVEP
jgi:hypothetical protein